MIKLSYKLLSGGLVISILLHCKVGSPRGSTVLQIVLIMHKGKILYSQGQEEGCRVHGSLN